MSAIIYGWKDKKDDQSFWLRFAACTREPESWKEEVYAAARQITERTKKPIWICSSGGIDSEIACRAFFDQGIPFSVLSLEHTAGTNQYDIRYTTEWCEAHKVPQKIVKIDMQEFLTTGIEKYVERYPAVHPFRYIQIKLMELVEQEGGFALLCSGEQVYWTTDLKKPELTRDDLYLQFSNGTVMPLEWCKDNGTDHEPYFHFMTPELCLAYLRLPIIELATRNPGAIFRHPINAYFLKRMAYMTVWTDIKPRQKFDGYERIQMKLSERSLEHLQKVNGPRFMPRNISVPEFERQLTGA